MAKIKKVPETETVYQLVFMCPGCGDIHAFHDKSWSNGWDFNGDMERPTVSPSIMVTWEEGTERTKNICHSFITDGEIQFLDDCTHKLKGQTVELPEIK